MFVTAYLPPILAAMNWLFSWLVPVFWIVAHHYHYGGRLCLLQTAALNSCINIFGANNKNGRSHYYEIMNGRYCSHDGDLRNYCCRRLHSAKEGLNQAPDYGPPQEN